MRLMKKSKNMCSECGDDFYNGTNPYGVKECWNFKSAKVVARKEIPIDQQPPWKQKPIVVLNCFHKKGFVYWDPERER